MKRANTERLHDIFNKVRVHLNNLTSDFIVFFTSQYASQEVNGEKFMTPTDFIRGFLGLFPDENFNKDSVTLLGGIIDTSKDG